MKIRVEQLNPVIGDIQGNVQRILDSLREAESDGIDLLILPEMVLAGYPPQDLLEIPDFRQVCFRANDFIAENTADTAILFGTLTGNSSETGRKIFNSALLCRSGQKIGMVHKTLLPTYDIFDDLRYFEPAPRIECLELDGLKLGVTICEDIWYNQNEVQYHQYEINPAAELKALGAQVIINISASPYTSTKHESRTRMLRHHATDLGLPLFFSNQAGAQTDVVFDGNSLVMDAKGEILAAAGAFRPGYADVVWDPAEGTLSAQRSVPFPENTEFDQELFEAILLGIRDYLEKTGISRDVVLGLSGGIDSALVAVLAKEALGADHVTALAMPGEFSSSGSILDSRKLADNLGIDLHEVPISNVYDCYRQTLAPLFEGTGFGVAEENIQSRIRGALLMAWSNKFGHMLLTTGNKSELAVGYATLYGDMNGGFNPIGDLYKTEVFRLCEWLNQSYYGEEIIPRIILDKPPSAELRADQKDTDTLPEYEILDDILWRYLELQVSAGEIVSGGGHDKTVVSRVLKMVDRNEFKRFQAPPILKLSSKSFGSGRRWPLVQGWSGQTFG